jgi:hypothetical protein
MERGTTKDRLRAAATIAAAAAGVSCGTGIRDGEGYFFVSETIDQKGGQLALREAILDICEGCMPLAGTVTLRRYEQIELSGAIGPIFQIETPSPDSFANDASISIATSPAVAKAARSAIGSLPTIDGSVVGQWTPNAVDATQACMPGSVCGRVTRASFAGSTVATNTVYFAILERCSAMEDCPSKQTCTSAACQDCPKEVPCNL